MATLPLMEFLKLALVPTEHGTGRSSESANSDGVAKSISRG